MMKTLMLAAMAAALLAANQASADEPPDYSALIRQATPYVGRGLAPSEEELQAAKVAMSQLVAEKDAVAAFIIERLRSYRYPDSFSDPAAGLLPDWNPWRLERYGLVLRELGPEYIVKLEPAVLAAPDEQVRGHGVWILGQCASPEALRKTAVDLLVKVLTRDSSPAVQADAISALGWLQAVDRSELVAKYLSSEHPEARRAAVGFYFNSPEDSVFDQIKAMLETEMDPQVGFTLARVLVRNHKLPARTLLTHRNPGVRGGALHCLAQGSMDISDEDRAAVVGLLDAETDPRCQYELAACLRRWKDPRCLGLFIAILNGPEDLDWLRGERVKRGAADELASLTDGQLRVTNEDRAHARETGGCMYDGLAARSEAWWRENKDRLVWNEDRRKFLIIATEAVPAPQPALPADVDQPDR